MNTQTPPMRNILLQITQEDVSYLPLIKPILSGRANVFINNITPDAIMEVVMSAKAKGCKYVATTDHKLLHLLLGRGGSVDDYAGSIIEKQGIEFLVLNPIEHLVTVPHGRHIFERYFSKFIHPENWLNIPDFSWEVFDPAKVEEYYQLAETCTFQSADIETRGAKSEAVITCIGFTFVHIDAVGKGFTARTVVVPFTDMFNVTFVRNLLRRPKPKVFQNGKYDIAHLLRYNIAPTNYAFDTINLFHCWYSELPKRLDFITSYMLRKWQYWKDESKTTDLMEYYMYNAKDAFTTAMDFLALMVELPPFALTNYTDHEFPLVFPCILAEATGIKADPAAVDLLQKRFAASMEQRKKKLQIMVANPFFNPGSTQQTVRLFQALGCGDIKSSGKIQRDKVMARHPLNKKLLKEIESYRQDSKLESTYFDKEKIFNGRWFYALNPHGTDTFRLASKESQFWCGLQVQNIPRDRKDVQVKDCFVADTGFFLGEADGEQAETRDTAYLSGDLRLIEAVTSSRDFHASNAEAFFGVPYTDIIAPDGSVIDKELRDLAKRPNHGANYNMTPPVLLDTMGIENVIRAKKLLKLPVHWSLLKVCEYLMQKFDETYPVVRGDYYKHILNEIATTGMLVSAVCWTRYCFGRPDKAGKFAKRDINRYAAHKSQNLNACVLNLAWRKVFNEVWLKNMNDFKLHAQIHDSIVFSYRKGRTDLALQVKKLMEIPVKVKDTYGIERTLIVPVALKGEAERWSQLKKIAA